MSVTYLDTQDFLKNQRLLEAERKVGRTWLAYDRAMCQADQAGQDVNLTTPFLLNLRQEWKDAQAERDRVWDPLA